MKIRNSIFSLSLAIAFILTILTPFALISDNVAAEGIGVGISVSSSSVEIGSTITVSVNASRALPLENYMIEVTYDPSIVSYSGFSDRSAAATAGANPVSGNKVIATAFGGSTTTANLFQMTFTANATGTAAFSITSAEVLTEWPPTGSSASVEIRAPLPGNANLKSLSVDQGILSPAFSPGQLSYSLSVAMGVDRIAVSAEAEDPVASVSVSGNTGLQDGANTIRVVVTAQNGSTNTYTITANRQGPTPTPEPTPTPPVSVTINGNQFSVVDPPEEVEIPAGFYKTTIEINGQLVTAFKSVQGDLFLLYLSNDGPESGFYFYDPDTGEFYPFAILSVPGATFIRITPDDDVEIPTGFTEASITIDGEVFECWRPLPDYDNSRVNDQNGDIYLLYLLNAKGEKGFYLYQLSSRLIFPYDILPGRPEPTPEPTSIPTPEPTPEPEDTTVFSNPYIISTIILGIISVVFLGLFVWSLIKNGRGGGPGGSGGSSKYNASGNKNDYIEKPPKIRRVD